MPEFTEWAVEGPEFGLRHPPPRAHPAYEDHPLHGSLRGGAWHGAPGAE